MPTPHSTSRTVQVAAIPVVAAATLAVGLALGWLDSRDYLWCPGAAHGWIAGEHWCRSFVTVSATLAMAEILLSGAVFLISRWAGWQRFGPWLSLIPLVWLAVGVAGWYREAADLVAPTSADKVEFFGPWDRPLAWAAALLLGLGVAGFLVRTIPRARAGRVDSSHPG